ncbi:MAG: hypothetical protein U0944_01880, partial [Candidatus Moranbacteria bacterium]|nr:hypothetical protein [bacterium]MDP1833823.1 hypothetical protein [Candidatus Moranbacteria bacterium]MDZ4385146.1 hypothetical protein [Candidatus Moranbacteria bacterium]
MKNILPIKLISAGILAFVLAVMPFQTPKSEAWLEFAGQMMAHNLAIMRETINGITMGALKQMAIQTINTEISVAVGGSSSQNSRLIGNYRDFLHIEPLQKTNRYMNDYLSQITRGRGSEAGYIPNEGFGAGAFVGGLNHGNYIAQLRQSAMAVTVDRSEPIPTYIGNPRQNMFANGNMDNFNLYLSGVNNPWAFNLNAEQKYQERLAVEKEAAQTEAIAGQGYKGTRQGDTITTPGSLISATMSNVQNLGLSVLASARNTPEVVTATVQNILTQSIQNGIGNSQRNVQREIQGVTNKTNQAINTEAQTTGPASAWKNPNLAQ